MSDFITIPLSKTGKYAGKYETLVSIEDSDLADLNWSVESCVNTQYAVRRIRTDGKQKGIKLHRVILSRVLGQDLSPPRRCRPYQWEWLR